MLWRVERGGKSWDAFKGEPAKAAFRSGIEEGRVQGVLAFAAEEAVGWCSLGPREDFPRLLRSRVLQRERSGRSWAITCLFLARHARRRALGTRLLDAASGHAFAAGADEIEGYPVRVTPGTRLSDSFLWTGTPIMFERAGFVREAARGSPRDIYVKRRAMEVA
jgi:GNAT superfamily N-acetyltransferase